GSTESSPCVALSLPTCIVTSKRRTRLFSMSSSIRSMLSRNCSNSGGTRGALSVCMQQQGLRTHGLWKQSLYYCQPSPHSTTVTLDHHNHHSLLSSSTAIARYLAVAVPSPLRRLLHYLPPSDSPLPLPGMRVQVPFGRRQLVGIVVRIDSTTDQDPAKLRPASEILDTDALLDPALLALYQWASSYYLY